MSTHFIIPHLSERLASMTQNAIGLLEAGVAAGEIKNALYIDAKDTINRAMAEGSERFLATGPHAQKHHQSDWWLAAYQADAFLSGAHYLPAALKRAQKAALPLKPYADFLAALLPLADLLVAAKSLVVKRQSGPQASKTPAQLEREAATMTCQCCAGRFLANTGTIAHHGYQRPGHGWQTPSCMGAKHLPFEVDRSRLLAMIDAMTRHHGRLVKNRRAVNVDKLPILRSWRTRDYSTKEQHHEFQFTKQNFGSAEGQEAARKIGFYGTWVGLKKADLAYRDREIAALMDDINRCQARYDGWKQTHYWHSDKVWVLLSDKPKRIKA